MPIMIFLVVAAVANIALWIATLLLSPSAFSLADRVTLYALAGTGLSVAAILAYGFMWWTSYHLPVATFRSKAEAGTGTGSGTGDGSVERRTNVGQVTALAVIAVGILLIAGVLDGEVQPMRAALMLLLGGGALFTILVVVDRLAAGSEVEVSSHWGGLGGSLGGWRISQTAILLILALLLVSATLAASGIAGGGGGEQKNQTAADEKARVPEKKSAGSEKAAVAPAGNTASNAAGGDRTNVADNASANAARNDAAPVVANVSAEGAR